MLVVLQSLDQTFILASTRQRTTLRQLVSEGRLTLRQWGTAPAKGATVRRKALSVDVAHATDPTASEGFDIAQTVYDHLLAMGVPEAPPA